MQKDGSDDSRWKSILAKDIDEYLSLVPANARNALQDLRRMIKTAAPEATEAIYYRIPTFMHHGPLVAFSASKTHCSLHLMSPPLMQAHKEELRSYDTTTATIRFRVDDPLPADLVTKLIKERMQENEGRANR